RGANEKRSRRSRDEAGGLDRLHRGRQADTRPDRNDQSHAKPDDGAEPARGCQPPAERPHLRS
ncbi:hypothetical protein SB912_30890, partial [Pantoea sp. SIMBA_072]